MGDHEELICVLALGYGATQGVPHKSKAMSELCNLEDDMPEWFRKGDGGCAACTNSHEQTKTFFSH